MIEFSQSAGLLLVLLNPFLVIVYLIDILQKLGKREFTTVLIKAAVIAAAVFCVFAILGDAVFTEFVHAEFASFQIFGGVIFLLIGLQFVFKGPTAIEILRGESPHLAGAIAMPGLIGPGTISASVVVGKRHDPLVACGVVVAAVLLSTAIMILLKSIHDYVRPRREPLIEHYIEIAGRITALVIGTVSVDMIMQGLRDWIHSF